MAPYGPRLSIPLPSEEAFGKLIGETYDPTKTLNAIKMFADTGDIFLAIIGFLKALFQVAGIDPKAREVIALRAAKVLEYLLIISWFNLLSRYLNGCRVPLETSHKIGGNTLPI